MAGVALQRGKGISVHAQHAPDDLTHTAKTTYDHRVDVGVDGVEPGRAAPVETGISSRSLATNNIGVAIIDAAATRVASAA